MDSAARVATSTTTRVAIGPDMQELWRRFPPRQAVSSWPATEQTRQELMERLLSSPLGAAGGRRRWLALVHLLDWLAAQPGQTWQQRWQASGADELGNAVWWRPLLAWLRPDGRACGVGTSSGLRVSAQLLISADVIRPTVQWVMTPRAPQNLVPLMAGLRDPSGFTELCPLLRPDPAQRQRLLEVRDNLIARIAEARQHGWLGEVDGLQISLNGAREKLHQLDQISSLTTDVNLGLPSFGQLAGRST